MTCRDEILSELQELLKVRPQREFRLGEILRRMAWRNTPYVRVTISNYVTAVMCVNSNAKDGGQYQDLERVGRGVYRLLE
ncbi:hypothetical protein HNQ07_004168 [Deinococcus metalli]|uniref:DUF7669 domain-containing protein n=1 Tax=Deinococcus metalli TaxID=1141878 RepID=A0A7W8KKI0_9DEIO|nr:hypothetical protein [Deinococcus metalli]MBB5378661.1 hypothetical protein [Deinococcus metalli]GHF61487.1 hypothetical protein GCM10017781_42070 [Deinococcus metalli]